MQNSPHPHDPIALFASEWGVYRKVVEHNYMFHREIYARLKAFLDRQLAGRPASILELGCGDASQTAKALSDCRISRYVGYDLSASALACARQNLVNPHGTVEWVCGDLLDGVAEAEGFDGVLVSFALHHLGAGDKREFFRRARRAINQPGGFLLLVDVMREDDQSLGRYLKDYLGYMHQHWTALSEEELHSIHTHIDDNDLPESAAWHLEAAAEAGFATAEKLARHTWHQAWHFA